MPEHTYHYMVLYLKEPEHSGLEIKVECRIPSQHLTDPVVQFMIPDSQF